MRAWPGLMVLALIGMSALGEAQSPTPAAPQPLPLRPLWQPEQARAIRQWQVTGPTTMQLSQLLPAAWRDFTSWQDQVNLAAPAGPVPALAGRRVAATTVTSAAAREALVSVGSGPGYRLWLNGALVGEGPGSPAYYPDAMRHPVQLRAGENRLVIELNTAGEANFSVRLLEPAEAPSQPTRLAPG